MTSAASDARSATPHSTHLEQVSNVAEPRATDGLPATLLRGLNSPKWIESGVVLLEAFLPDPRTAAKRVDGQEETSTNWEDTDAVLAATLRQQSAQHGAARISKMHVRYVRECRGTYDVVDYERRAIPGNDHHGNLLFAAEASPRVKKMAANALALEAEHVPKPQKS